MGKEAKYIVMREQMYGQRVYNIYPFNSRIIHKDMAIKVGGELGPKRVVGAGFIMFTPEGPKCYGKSVSLRVSCRDEEDNKLAQEAFGDEY